MSKVLVTGGCGYIGSHTIVDLINNGYDVISVDNLSNSDTSSLAGIEKITGRKVKNYEVDLRDLNALRSIFTEHSDIVSIIHFAALKAVGESVEKPLLYYDNNIVGLLNLCQCCIDFDVKNFIFSSSCTVYGNAEELPVSESTPMKPAESPYGATKQMAEQIINDSLAKVGKGVVHLRYFNPAGAHESIHIGESPINKAVNLVPVITETGMGKREKTIVFGDDYDTRDGSCIRDYIHIMDLAEAHTKALQFLETNHRTQEVFNLGIGEGVSVLEAIFAFEKVSGKKLNYHIGPRRPGDVIAIYADNNKAANVLNWKPKRNIEDIMDTAWKWELKKSEN